MMTQAPWLELNRGLCMSIVAIEPFFPFICEDIGMCWQEININSKIKNVTNESRHKKTKQNKKLHAQVALSQYSVFKADTLTHSRPKTCIIDNIKYGFILFKFVSHDSVTVKQYAHYQDTETEALKCNSAFAYLSFYTCLL